jgi:hypothetical protein
MASSIEVTVPSMPGFTQVISYWEACRLGNKLNLTIDLTIINPLSDNAPYFIILLCLMPDDFTRQGNHWMG